MHGVRLVRVRQGIRLACACAVLGLVGTACGEEDTAATATPTATKAAGAATKAGGSEPDRVARDAARMLQDAMLNTNRSLDETTGTRASLARVALKLKSAGSDTGDAIALMTSAEYPQSAILLKAARSQRDYLEAMQAAASSRSPTDIRQALRSAQSAGRAASDAYVQLGRVTPDLAGTLPDASAFGVAALRTATAAATRAPAKKKATASPPSSSAVSAPSTAGSRTFHASSGNVTCVIDSETAACAVASLGKTFVVPASGNAFLEDGLRVGRGAGQQVPYGSTVDQGSISCDIPPENVARGVRCANASTGHGFEASRVASRQKLY